MFLEISPMTALIAKLNDLGGHGKFKQRDWRIRVKLNWHTKATSTVRHLLHGERKPSLDEAKQIEVAHFKHCAEKLRANRDENQLLFDSMRRSIEAMERSDPAFFSEQIEALGSQIYQFGNLANRVGAKD